MTHLTNISGFQHVWLLYHMIGNSQKHIPWTSKDNTSIRVGMISCPLNTAKTIEKAWHTAVGTVLSQLRHLDITGPGLKCDCANGFQPQCYPLLAAWVGDYPKEVMVAQVLYGSYLMCEISQGVPRGSHLFNQSITKQTSIFPLSCRRSLILILCTLYLCTQSATSSGNTLSAMCIAFGSLMNCISCSWV